MEVYFRDKRLQRLLSDPRECGRRYGADAARKVEVRLQTLAHAENLAQVFHAPGRCHPLKADRQGQYALDLRGGLRLVFAPGDDPLPVRGDGAVDTARVTVVVVLEVIDYHG